jgi:uncharacterized Zn-finger protein
MHDDLSTITSADLGVGSSPRHTCDQPKKADAAVPISRNNAAVRLVLLSDQKVYKRFANVEDACNFLGFPRFSDFFSAFKANLPCSGWIIQHVETRKEGSASRTVQHNGRTTPIELRLVDDSAVIAIFKSTQQAIEFLQVRPESFYKAIRKKTPCSGWFIRRTPKPTHSTLATVAARVSRPLACATPVKATYRSTKLAPVTGAAEATFQEASAGAATSSDIATPLITATPAAGKRKWAGAQTTTETPPSTNTLSAAIKLVPKSLASDLNALSPESEPNPVAKIAIRTKRVLRQPFAFHKATNAGDRGVLSDSSSGPCRSISLAGISALDVTAAITTTIPVPTSQTTKYELLPSLNMPLKKGVAVIIRHNQKASTHECISSKRHLHNKTAIVLTAPPLWPNTQVMIKLVETAEVIKVQASNILLLSEWNEMEDSAKYAPWVPVGHVVKPIVEAAIVSNTKKVKTTDQDDLDKSGVAATIKAEFEDMCGSTSCTEEHIKSTVDAVDLKFFKIEPNVWEMFSQQSGMQEEVEGAESDVDNESAWRSLWDPLAQLPLYRNDELDTAQWEKPSAFYSDYLDALQENPPALWQPSQQFPEPVILPHPGTRFQELSEACPLLTTRGARRFLHQDEDFDLKSDGALFLEQTEWNAYYEQAVRVLPKEQAQRLDRKRRRLMYEQNAAIKQAAKKKVKFKGGLNFVTPPITADRATMAATIAPPKIGCPHCNRTFKVSSQGPFLQHRNACARKSAANRKALFSGAGSATDVHDCQHCHRKFDSSFPRSFAIHRKTCCRKKSATKAAKTKQSATGVVARSKFNTVSAATADGRKCPHCRRTFKNNCGFTNHRKACARKTAATAVTTGKVERTAANLMPVAVAKLATTAPTNARFCPHCDRKFKASSHGPFELHRAACAQKSATTAAEVTVATTVAKATNHERKIEIVVPKTKTTTEAAENERGCLLCIREFKGSEKTTFKCCIGCLSKATAAAATTKLRPPKGPTMISEIKLKPATTVTGLSDPRHDRTSTSATVVLATHQASCAQTGRTPTRVISHPEQPIASLPVASATTTLATPDERSCPHCDRKFMARNLGPFALHRNACARKAANAKTTEACKQVAPVALEADERSCPHCDRKFKARNSGPFARHRDACAQKAANAKTTEACKQVASDAVTVALVASERSCPHCDRKFKPSNPGPFVLHRDACARKATEANAKATEACREMATVAVTIALEANESSCRHCNRKFKASTPASIAEYHRKACPQKVAQTAKNVDGGEARVSLKGEVMLTAEATYRVGAPVDSRVVGGIGPCALMAVASARALFVKGNRFEVKFNKADGESGVETCWCLAEVVTNQDVHIVYTLVDKDNAENYHLCIKTDDYRFIETVSNKKRPRLLSEGIVQYVLSSEQITESFSKVTDAMSFLGTKSRSSFYKALNSRSTLKGWRIRKITPADVTKVGTPRSVSTWTESLSKRRKIIAPKCDHNVSKPTCPRIPAAPAANGTVEPSTYNLKYNHYSSYKKLELGDKIAYFWGVNNAKGWWVGVVTGLTKQWKKVEFSGGKFYWLACSENEHGTLWVRLHKQGCPFEAIKATAL